MASIIMTTHVAASIERVFEVYTDLEKAVERIPDITTLELLSEGPFGEGTTVSWTFKGTPQTFGAKLTAPIFGLFFTGVMKKCMQRDLDALRDVCEGKTPADGPAPTA